MPRLAAEVVAVKACGINGLLPAAFVGGPLPFIPRFALTAPPSAARRPYNSSLENFWGEGLPINMPEDPQKIKPLVRGVRDAVAKEVLSARNLPVGIVRGSILEAAEMMTDRKCIMGCRISKFFFVFSV